MKVKADSKLNTVKFIPERDIDIYHLAKAFSGNRLSYSMNMSSD